MSLDAINWVAKQKAGNATAKHVLLWLAFHSNGKSGKCFPSLDTLAEEMEVGSKNTIRAALKTLLDRKLISCEREMKGARVARTFYRLNFDGSNSDTSNIEGSKIDISNIEHDGSNSEPYGSNIELSMVQKLNPNKEIEQGINKEANSTSMRTSGNSSAIADVASAQAQTLPTSFPQSSNSQNHSETKPAGKDSLPNASERSVAAHRDRPDTSDEQTRQNDAGCSHNASTCISGVCPENEPPPMSDEDLENLFADAQLDVGSKPNTVKAEAPKRRTATPRKKPATRCPFDAEALIPDDYRQIAEKAGIGDPQRVFSAFVNHALAHDRRLVIWPAGFRTWCSNEIRYHPNQTPKPKHLHQRTADDYNW